MKVSKRGALYGLGALVAGATAFTLMGRKAKSSDAGTFEVTKTDAEWRAQLTPAQYDVLRAHGTERSFTSPLNDEHRKGQFVCAACDLPLFASETKFDSGTGWPSFYDHLPDAIGRMQDDTFFMSRIEVHCRRCGGHQGHVFEDGPKPTGLRYCINGVAMNFVPATA